MIQESLYLRYVDSTLYVNAPCQAITCIILVVGRYQRLDQMYINIAHHYSNAFHLVLFLMPLGQRLC